MQNMTVWEVLGDAAISMVPPIFVGFLFWILMRSILRADRTERDVYAKIEAEERAKLELRPDAAASDPRI